jgi:hypothetical protein
MEWCKGSDGVMHSKALAGHHRSPAIHRSQVQRGRANMSMSPVEMVEVRKEEAGHTRDLCQVSVCYSIHTYPMDT